MKLSPFAISVIFQYVLKQRYWLSAFSGETYFILRLQV